MQTTTDDADAVDRAALDRMFPSWDAPTALGYGRNNARRGELRKLRARPTQFGGRWFRHVGDRFGGEIGVAR
jgi:hypothetical protein